MKKLFLLSAIVLVLFSCKKDEKYARFEPNKYTLHYDEVLNLKLVSSEEMSLFNYSSNDPNAVKISSTGKVEALYVGQATILAKYDNLRAECSVTVTPYEKLYSMLPVIDEGMNRTTVKLLEELIRNVQFEDQNVLVMSPSQDDSALGTLEYTFVNDGLVSVTAFLKDGTNKDKITTFMDERYPFTENEGYKDAHSGANVTHNEVDNSIEYTW